MLPKLEIHVAGKGSVFRTAERAYVRLTISSASLDQSKAFEEASSTVKSLTSKIRALATKTENGEPHPSAAVTAFTVNPLSSSSYWQRDENFRELKNLPKEHSVSTTAEVIFRDMAVLADLSNELATTPHLSVTGTEWRLTDATQLAIQREARLKAIRDAVQKAEDYAGVVGRQVAAIEILDGPSSGEWSGGRTRQTAQMGQMARQQQVMQQQQMAYPLEAHVPLVASDGPSLEPKTVTVAANVTAKFVSTDGADGDDGGINLG
jgi:uncharacterized protein YggE